MKFTESSSSAKPDERISIAPLLLDADEQAGLASRIHNLANDLYESPFVLPTYVTRGLREITLRKASNTQPGAFMNITSKANDEGIFAADITVTDRSKRPGESHTAYTYDSRVDAWEVWSRPGATHPDTQLENSSFVNLLDSQLPTGALESLYDSTPDGRMIVGLLQGHFAKQARKKERLATYSADHAIIEAEDFAADRHTELQVHSINTGVTHRLFVAAAAGTLYGSIEKAYAYTTEHKRRALYSAGGTVQMTGDAYIPQARLDAFARRDRIKNYPLDTLNAAIDELRSRYDVTE